MDEGVIADPAPVVVDMGDDPLIRRYRVETPTKQSISHSLNSRNPLKLTLDGSTLTSIYCDDFGIFDCATMEFEREPSLFTGDHLRILLNIMTLVKCSDIFLQDDVPVVFKRNRKVYRVSKRPLNKTEITDAIAGVCSPQVVARVAAGGESASVPFSVSVTTFDVDGEELRTRFRGNGTYTMGSKGARDGATFTFRRLGHLPPTMEDIKVPDGIRKFAFETMGLLLVSGETGSGKSTLLASFVTAEATSDARSVIATYEDPTEFDFRELPGLKSLIGQTNITDALGTFVASTRDAMRRSADVVLIGEIRDKDSLIGASLLAQTGHRVYGTTHSISIEMMIPRLLEMVDEAEREALRSTLIDLTSGLVNQRLEETVSGGLVPIQSWLEFTPPVRERLHASTVKGFAATLRELVHEFGHSMQKDLEQKRDLLPPEVFERLMRVYSK